MSRFSPLEYLYRRLRRRAIAVALAGAAPLAGGVALAAQGQKQSSGPRALAVVQTDSRGHRTLLPISIRVEGRFYDASVYKASPVPMALDPGTVYEVEQSGDSLGLFTVEQARPGANGAWLGTGQWQDKHALEQAKNNPPPAPQPRSEKPEAEDRPVLRKAPPRNTGPAGAPPPSTPPVKAPPNTAPPPTIGRPQEQPASGASSNPTPSAPPPASTSDANVPGRPVLRRGKPAEEAADAETGPEKSAAKPPGATAKSATLRYLPAISDADGPEPRPYFFAPKAGEEAEFRSQVMKMAQNAVAGYEKPRRPTFASAQITPQQFRIFDLDYSNQPVMVLTASAKITDRVTRRRAATADGKPEPAPELMVTVVARQDIYGELQPLFSSVTDRQHLDEFPRLELIDAVDADGDGRGELLFRETSDSGIGWAIYKPGPDKLARIFDTFAPED